LVYSEKLWFKCSWPWNLMYIVSIVNANDCVTQRYVGLDLLTLNSYLPPWYQISIINIDTDQNTVFMILICNKDISFLYINDQKTTFTACVVHIISLILWRCYGLDNWKIRGSAVRNRSADHPPSHWVPEFFPPGKIKWPGAWSFAFTSV